MSVRQLAAEFWTFLSFDCTRLILTLVCSLCCITNSLYNVHGLVLCTFFGFNFPFTTAVVIYVYTLGTGLCLRIA